MATGEMTAQARLRGKLALARDLLGMDVAMVTEVSDHQEIARYASGEWPGLGSIEGAFIQLEETFCHKLLDGAIPNWIGDVPGDERVADLRMAQTLGVGSWIGTLVRGPDHRLYVVCALSRSVHRDLGAGDLSVLRTFVVSILPELAAADWPVTPPPIVSHMRRVPTTLVVDFAQPVAGPDLDDLLDVVRGTAAGSELHTSYTQLTRRLTLQASTLDGLAALDELEQRFAADVSPRDA